MINPRLQVLGNELVRHVSNAADFSVSRAPVTDTNICKPPPLVDNRYVVIAIGNFY
jgi:hypothetical protein